LGIVEGRAAVRCLLVEWLELVTNYIDIDGARAAGERLAEERRRRCPTRV